MGEKQNFIAATTGIHIHSECNEEGAAARLESSESAIPQNRELTKDRNCVYRDEEQILYIVFIYYPPTVLGDGMTPTWFKVGSQSACTWARLKKCPVPTTNVALASIFHLLSLFVQ